MTEAQILITATSFDEHAYAPVKNILEKRGFPVVLYRTDRVMYGEDCFDIEVSDSGGLSITYNGISIAPHDIGSAWYRKVASFAVSDATTNPARQLFISNEVRLMHDAIWTLYPEHRWLNSPERMRKADRKIGQLLLAKEVGFSIPRTKISNNWDEVRDLLSEKDDKIIVKAIRGLVNDGTTIKALYTTLLDLDKIESIESTSTPFLGIYQPFINKIREWRVTVVKDRIFPAAIYTDESAKVDWRILQTTNAVDFRKEQLPEGIEEMCLRFLGRVGLGFGAFDLVEEIDGNIIFLECNPNGQYGWLEEQLGFPISSAIADVLIEKYQESN